MSCIELVIVGFPTWWPLMFHGDIKDGDDVDHGQDDGGFPIQSRAKLGGNLI